MVNQQGEKAAVMLVNTIDAYNITLADGRHLQWNGMTGKRWSYSYEGQVVAEGNITKADGKKKLSITIMDTSLPFDVLRFMVLERGTDKLVSASATGPIIGVAVLVAVLQAAANSSDL